MLVEPSEDASAATAAVRNTSKKSKMVSDFAAL